MPISGLNTPPAVRNFLRNSGFWFAQRQVPGTLTTYSSATARLITADGWGLTCENASSQYQRTDTAGASAETGLQSQYYGNFTKITSTGKLFVSQVIEARETSGLRTQTVRVDCKLKQIIASAPVVNLWLVYLTSAGTVDALPATFISAVGANTTDPTLGTNITYLTPNAGSADASTPANATISGNKLKCTLSASWQRFGASFIVPQTAKNLVVMVGGDSQFAATNGFAMSEASLTVGNDVPDWNPGDYSNELERCQRFYQKTFNVDTGPVQSAGAGTGEFRYQSGTAGALGDFGWYQFALRMIAAPATITTYNPAAGNAQVRDITAAADCSATAVSVTTETGTMITDTGNVSTAVGNKLGVHITADAEL